MMAIYLKKDVKKIGVKLKGEKMRIILLEIEEKVIEELLILMLQKRINKAR